MFTNGRRQLECPEAHFRQETLAYLNGDSTVLNKLPAVKASALRKALDSKTQVVRPKCSKSSPPWRAEKQAGRARPSHGITADQGAKGTTTPTLPLVDDKPAFAEMVQRELPFISIHSTPRPRSVHEVSVDDRSRHPSISGIGTSSTQLAPFLRMEATRRSVFPS
ncbi:uncharacterized protein THITE_2127983 [Thermothielavioides terrestris NRRL 8126]|uniref:Uncharacterized protein n=1 Tax=Thermothielavioides terrestris (strain ATCC 38088 / NRRL 8126) TaxID=578455 RepID=G2R2G3_THETT|nr:uncharacterized protein THITE_2127983 [Thermothielavioides terrestris NRRL 8126]AEO65836.1 hypothetical protein THITE_2127983 [Thermothielavioides terrestris NRRL 8126]